MEEIQDSLFTFMSIGTKGAARERVSFISLLSNVLEALKPEIEKGKAEIRADCDMEFVTDRVLLSLILKNLIENAIVYVREGVRPEIEISCSADENYITINVMDNGIGIPEDKREEIFRPFVRLHSVETYPGTGLGLSIVKKAVEMLEGFVGVYSNEKRGSTFYVRLPLRGRYGKA